MELIEERLKEPPHAFLTPSLVGLASVQLDSQEARF